MMEDQYILPPPPPKKSQPAIEELLPPPPKKKEKTDSNDGAKPLESGLSGTPKVETIPVEQKNPIDLAADYNILSNAKKEISMGAGGVAMGTGSAEVPDEEKTKAAQDLRDKTLKESGIDLHDLANETKGLIENDFGKQGFSKEELLNDRATNNELYHRKLNSLKWKSGLDSELANQLVNGNIDKDVYDGLKHNIDVSLQNAGTGNFEQQRQNINSVANTIKEYGGEKKDELLNNYAVEAAKVYGNSWKSGGIKASEGTPESKYLTNTNAELGYQYLKDISPDKAAQYERLFIDPKSIKDDPDAKKGYNHLMQTLEETGVALQDNAVKEDLNNLINISKKNGGLSPEQLEQAKKLTAKQDELTKAKAELDTKYPDRIENKVDDAMTEILGQKLGWGMYAGGMAGKAFKNTGEGIWEMVSEPFMSDQSNIQRELALMGESKFDEDVYKKSDANKGLQTEKLVVEPELQKQIDSIKNDKSLTDEQKQQKLYPLLKSNTDKFGKVPTEGGKMNISPSSILYGLTDLGTTLLPFLAIETATGGIGGTSTAAKFLKTFTAAAATGFHDEYANAVNSGKSESEAFKQALGVTAINSAAMAGAGTGEKVKALFAGGKSSAAKIIEGMSEDAINKVLAEGTPKWGKDITQKIVGKSKQIGNKLIERIKQVPEQFKKGIKAGATFEAAMTGAKEAQHQIYNTPIDREQNFKQSLLNIANFGLAGVIGGQAGYKSPTELQKSNLIEFGKNPNGFLATAEKMKKDGQLTQQEFDHRKDLIEKSGVAYKSLPKSNAKGKPLSEKEKGEYLYNNVIKNEAKKAANELPPKQAEKSLHVSMVADYKNDIILENPTDKQLESRKDTLEKQIENKDEEDKPLLNETEMVKVKAQLDAVNETIDQRSKGVSVQPPMQVPEPITVNGEFKIPSGIEVQEPMKVPEPITIGEKNIPNEETKTAELPNTEKEAGTTDESTAEVKPAAETEEGGKTGIKHESTESKRKEYGLGEYERDNAADSELEARATEAIKKGYDAEKLVQKLERGVPPTGEENFILKKYLAGLESKFEKNRTDENLQAVERVYKAVEKIGSLQSEAFRTRKGLTPTDDSLAGFFMTEKSVNNDAPLTEKQKETAKADFERLDEVREKLDADQKEFEEKVAAFKAEQELAKTKKKVSGSKKRTHEELVKERENIFKSIGDKWKNAGKDTLSSDIPYRQQIAAIAPDIIRLGKNLVEDGIIKLEEVVKNIHEKLKDDTDLTERDIHDVLAGEYNKKSVTKKEAAIQYENIRQKAALLNKLEKAETGFAKTEKQKIKKNQEIESFKKQLGIDKLEQLQALKGRIHSEMKKAEETLKSGNFSIPEKKIPLMEDKELQKRFPKEFAQARNSIDQYIKIKREIGLRRLKQMYENKTSEEKAIDVFSKSMAVPRTLMASMDFSAPLRQGIVATVSHPQIASKALKFMFEAAKDEKVYNRWIDSVHNDPRWVIAEKTGLGITDPESLHVKQSEEAFQGAPYAEKIPIIGEGVKASERAYIGYLNKLRWDLFNMYADRFEEQGKTFDNNKKLYEGISSFINSATGRGGMKGLENAAPVLNWFLFATKLISSRLNMLGLSDIPNLVTRGATLGKYGLDYGFYTRLPKELRIEAAKDMAKFVAVGVATLAIARAAGADVELDPRSSDFGKIKVGNTRWDIWGGFQQYARVLTQVLAGERKTTTTGQIKDLDKKNQFGETRFTPLANFGRGKLAPIPASVIDLATHRDASGQPVTLKSELLGDVIPLVIQDTYSAMKDDGVKALFTVGIPAAFGVGVQTYQPKQSASSRKPPKAPKTPKPKHFKTSY